MDPRLQEASFSGDVHSLQQLLREDRLLLNRPTYCTDTPLHVAAALGHADFAAEVLRLRPDLAFELGAGGHTPLHLAAANGRVAVVKVLLQLMLRNNSNAAELCLLRDKDGLTPVHTAALKGRTDVMRELVGACPNVSARDANGRGETALHLAVRSGSFEAVEFLVGDDASAAAAELLNSKDDKGNTALHLAVARKQFQTVKLVLSKPSVDVNSANLKGLTPLDVLLESPNEQYGDMALDEMIRAAGGKTAAEVLELSPTVLLSRRAIRRQKRVEEDDMYQNTPGTLMVVATLIATITFQTALNPPGGFNQNQDNGKSPGKVVLGEKLHGFLMFDVIGLFASMSIILLLIYVTPRRKMMMRFLSWIMFVAVMSTALAFQSAIVQIYDRYIVIDLLADAWFGILNVAVVWICFRFVIFLLKNVGWWKGRRFFLPKRVEYWWKERRHGHAGGSGGCGGLLLVVKRIGVVAAVLVAVGATVGLTYLWFFL